MWKKIQMLFLGAGFALVGITSANAQVSTCSTLSCTSGLDSDCQNPCGECWECDTTTFLCVPNDSLCTNNSGGLVENVCRNAVCIPTAVFGDSNLNPTGCDYSIDLTATADQCTLCETPRPPDVSTCGDGSCEPDLGETCSNCALDCLVPGFDLACPRDTDGAVCTLGITFPGPPWVLQSNDQQACEDGDVCTSSSCGPNGCAPQAPVTTCSGDFSDLCCPAGCTPAPDGAGSCPDLLGTTCDVDCVPEEYCPFCGNDIVDPGEECDGTATNGQCDPALCNNATCTCNVVNHCVQGSGFNNNSLAPDCTGWSGCSLNTLAQGSAWNLLQWVGMLFLGLPLWRLFRRA